MVNNVKIVRIKNKKYSKNKKKNNQIVKKEYE